MTKKGGTMKTRLVITIICLIFLAATDIPEVIVTVEKLRGGDITRIKAISENDIYLLTQGAGALKSTDGGIEFDKLYASLSNQTLFNNNIYSILINGDTIYIGGGSKNFVFSPGLHVSTDGGNSYQYIGLEGTNINDMIKYNNKILCGTQGLGVQSYENNTLTSFGTGMEQANVSVLYYGGGHLVAGDDTNLHNYDSSYQNWLPTSLNLPVVDITSNSSVYIASPNEINETTDFANFNPVAELNLGESFNFATIAYKDSFLYAGIVPLNYENNIPLVNKINLNTNTWIPDTAGQSKDQGIPQDLTVFQDRILLATSTSLRTKLTTSESWEELTERLIAANLTKVSYNNFDNSFWTGGAQGDVRVAFDINGEWTKNEWGLRLGVQINDFEFTSLGAFAVQYSGVYYQENIGDHWENRKNSNGCIGIAWNPNNNTLVLATFNELSRSTDQGFNWESILTGYFDQAEYIQEWDKFIVSDLNNLLSSDGSGQSFGIFAAGVQSLDFAVKNNSNGTKLGVAEVYDFKEVGENGGITIRGYSGLPSGAFVEKVTYNSSSDAWEGSYDNKLVELSPTTNEWEQKDQTINYISCLTRGGSTNYSNSIGEDILLVGTLGGGLYASASAVGVDDENIISKNFNLEQNYPNPFNPSTRIKYVLGSRQFVTIKIYDVLGIEIETLVNEEKPAGNYVINFNSENLSSGIYFYQLKTKTFVETKKMILLK